MIISKPDFLERARLDRETLEVWIEEEWLLPSRTANELAFSEMDLARAKLIRDLKHDLGVNDEGVGVILNLLDQIHGLRKVMADLLQSAHEQSARVHEVSSIDLDQGDK
jgi:chaperone modulatory protein CbpM